MDAVRDMTGHWPASAVHFEDFGAGKAARAEDDKPLDRPDGAGQAPIDATGKRVDPLEALRANGHRIPSPAKAVPAARAG
jgi:phthalate 4,5-dioxygenase reductase subunit